MRLENISLAQKMDEVINIGHASIFDSFENSSLQVENCYSPLHVLGEQIWLDQIFKDGQIVSLKYMSFPYLFFTFLLGSLI